MIAIYIDGGKAFVVKMILQDLYVIFLWLRLEHNSVNIVRTDLHCPGNLSPAEWAQVAIDELCLEIPIVSSS